MSASSWPACRRWHWAAELAALVPRAVRWLVRTVDGALLLLLGVLARWWPRRGSAEGRDLVIVTNTMAVGGAQRQILLWLTHRASRVGPVRLVLLTGGGAWEAEVARQGVLLEVVEEQLRRSRWGRRALEAVPRCAYLWWLIGLFRRARPQVLWSWLFLARAVATPAARLAGVPCLLTSVRSMAAWKTWPENRHWWYRAADRNAAALCDRVLVNAQGLVADYACWAKCAASKIRVVVNGVKDAEHARAAFTARSAKVTTPPVVLSVGRLAVVKGQGVLLAASAQLARAGVAHRLMLVGGGPLLDELRQRCQALGIDGLVTFVGEVPGASQHWLEADIFALSSRIEGMPNALMEAQLCGLPAVTTDAGGAREVVVDGETGFVVPVGDEAAFAAALKRLLEDPELRRRMGEAGRRRMLEVFPVERMVREMDEVFAELGVGQGDARGR